MSFRRTGYDDLGRVEDEGRRHLRESHRDLGQPLGERLEDLHGPLLALRLVEEGGQPQQVRRRHRVARRLGAVLVWFIIIS